MKSGLLLPKIKDIIPTFRLVPQTANAPSDLRHASIVAFPVVSGLSSVFRFFHRPSSIVALALLIAGCASAPRVQHPTLDVHPPDAYQIETSHGAPADTLWWAAFNDAHLNALIDHALEQNHNLHAVASRLNAAQAQAKIAGAGRLPQIGAGFSGARSKRNFIGFPIPAPPGAGVPASTSNTFGLSLQTSWEIDLWNQLGAAQAASLANLQATEALYRGARLSLSAQTAKAYFAAIEAQHQRELARATYENHSVSYKQVRHRYEAGVRPSLDVRLSQSDLASAQDRLHQAELQFQIALRQLEVLLGHYPSGKLALESNLPALPDPIPTGLPADLVAQRPDLVVAERRLAATHAALVAARRALYPRISLTASGGTSSDQLGDLLNGDFSVWNLVGNIAQPLFQGGRIRGNIDLAKAHSEEALATYAQSVLQAYAEVENALTAEHHLSQRQAALEIAAEQALSARRLAEDRYNRGLTDLITMLSAQRTAYLTESQLLQVRRQRLNARIDLHLSLGGGFSTSAITSVGDR